MSVFTVAGANQALLCDRNLLRTLGQNAVERLDDGPNRLARAPRLKPLQPTLAVCVGDSFRKAGCHAEDCCRARA